ncbi:hypothetical protein FQN60_006941, partial [Etheostoma spectabile]
MKVTVTFGDTSVVVPCKAGWTVRDLVDQATRRYRRILEQWAGGSLPFDVLNVAADEDVRCGQAALSYYRLLLSLKSGFSLIIEGAPGEGVLPALCWVFTLTSVFMHGETAVNTHHLEYVDGGILDMDDLLIDLVEDRDK